MDGTQIIGWLGATTGHELDGRMARIRAMCMERLPHERKAAERAAAMKVAVERVSVQLRGQLEQPERPAVHAERQARVEVMREEVAAKRVDPEACAEHEHKSAEAYGRLCVMADQLPDNPNVLHGGPWADGRRSPGESMWSGRLTAREARINNMW